MTVDVFAADEQNDHPVDALRWARLAQAVLGEEGLSGDAELSVLFVDESAIAELNSRFLGKEGPTDVLAFPIDEEPIESGRSPDSGGTGPGMPSEPEDMPVLLGDIVICPAVAYRNAPEHAGNYNDEVALLVVHGLLHLLGMDHQEDEEAEEMEARERELLARHYAEIRAEAWAKPQGEDSRSSADGALTETGSTETGPTETPTTEAGPVQTEPVRTGPTQTGPAETELLGVGQIDTGQLEDTGSEAGGTGAGQAADDEDTVDPRPEYGANGHGAPGSG